MVLGSGEGLGNLKKRATNDLKFRLLLIFSDNQHIMPKAVFLYEHK